MALVELRIAPPCIRESCMPIFNGNSPEDFYWQVVRPRYKEFLGATTDKGRAITAIIYAYHLFELVNSIPRNDQTPFRKHVANRYPYDPVFVEYLDAAKRSPTVPSTIKTGSRRELGEPFLPNFPGDILNNRSFLQARVKTKYSLKTFSITW